MSQNLGSSGFTRDNVLHISPDHSNRHPDYKSKQSQGVFNELKFDTQEERISKMRSPFYATVVFQLLASVHGLVNIHCSSDI